MWWLMKTALGMPGLMVGIGRAGEKKEKSSVGALDENVSNDEDTEMHVTEWVDMPKGKPVTCPFLKPSPESERR
jgi:hypothetical protein